MNNFVSPDETGTGYLQVRVFTAGGAFPVEGAQVYVTGTGENSGVIESLVTDISGLTRRIALPAPPAGLSMSPGNKNPYGAYNIQIRKEGFNTVDDMNVPIFENVTSIQPVQLVPIAESRDGSGMIQNGGNITIEESTGEDL